MRAFWLIFFVAAPILSHCKSPRGTIDLKDAFLESPIDGKHQVVYLDGDSVYRVFCGEEHKFTTETLTRRDCSHTNENLKFERLDFEKEYAPKLASFLKIQNPRTIRREIAYLKAALEKLGQRHVEEGLENTLNPNYGSSFEREIKAIENRLSTAEPQLQQIALFEAVVGSPDGQRTGLLDITQTFRDFAVSHQSLALLAPFDGGPGAITSDGKLEFIHKGAKFAFVAINAGRFLMGSPIGERGRDEDEGLHKVTISEGFLMQTTEVTRGQYRAIMGSYPEDRSGIACEPEVKQDDHPVSCVSWEDAQRFVQQLNAEENGNPYRLPTEAEWEFASRCGTTGPFSKDGVAVSDSILASANIAWFDHTSNGGTNPVAQLEANKCGLHDIHGNVWEWVEDAYQENYPEEEIDPKVTVGSSRVMRGGGWFNPTWAVRSANRLKGRPGERYDDLGFRLLRTNH